MTDSTQLGRIHLVLVPGFGGFDALGEVEYYSGTTKLFKEWRRSRQSTAPSTAPSVSQPVLHYFDNFPTAGVKTRARLLLAFLAKRIARNDIQDEHDTIVLIGHSTGGLDIRQLLWDLAEERDIAVDGSEKTAVRTPNRRLREMIRRVVFLSVPQRGTNIANWAKHHGSLLQRLLSSVLDNAVDLADVRGVEQLDVWIAKHVSPRLVGEKPIGLVAAIADVQLEMAERSDPDPLRAALGRAAHGSVNTWLGHVKNDFMALQDLMAGNDSGESPAAFSALQQQEELRRWGSADWPEIGVRSYATLGRCPFDERWQRERDEVPRGLLARLIDAVDDSVGNVLGDVLGNVRTLIRSHSEHGKSDLVYRFAYLICSDGPFRAPRDSTVKQFGSLEPIALKAWYNDGIVNTASMLWPKGETLLVHADHGDIIGHFAFSKVDDSESRGRKYHSYDILESSSAAGDTEFALEQFNAVWNDVFDFAVLGE